MTEGKSKLHGEGGETGDALRRIQTYKIADLVRETDLGAKFALKEIVEPATKIQSLFKLILPSHLKNFPEQQNASILEQSNAFFNFLEQCRSFEIEGAQPTPTEAKEALIRQAQDLYQGYFNILFPLISFAVARSQDFARLEQEARSASQAARDEAQRIIADLAEQKEAADVILLEVRAAAAEQGVSKQAIHFKNEADNHRDSAKSWFKSTAGMAILLVIYAILSLFLHEIPGLDPSDSYRTMQIAVSKILIFAVIAYFLFLCARNFMSHRHNEVVNRHRQNALATFTALAEATSDAASSDIVLSHAASCIFSPQDTGYSKGDSHSQEAVPSLQLIPRIGSMGHGVG